MSEYVLPHSLSGEEQRLALMSQLLDPLERSHIERLGLRAGWCCLEVGCGDGSISQWLATRVVPGGRVVASDADVRYMASLQVPGLEIRQLDVLEDPIEEGAYDLVTARAILHHISSPEKAVRRMLDALKPGGVFLSIEPDMLPATVVEPESMRDFWQGWLQWSVSVGIDYSIGRKMPALVSSLGLQNVGAKGHTFAFNGSSPWATYWVETMKELQPRLVESGRVTERLMSDFNARFADPSYWTSVITFVATWGSKSAR
jgi:SAM-dependent methyltransferase